MKTLRAAVIAAFIALIVAGCSSSSTTPGPTTPPVQHLYIADRGSPSTIYVFTLPLATTSTPAVTLLTTGNYAGNPCFDNAGHIFVPMGNDDKIQVFSLPLTSASTPAFTLSTTSTGRACSFDPSGNLYVAESSNSSIEVFKAPVTSSSVVNSTITSAGLTTPWGVWTDASGNVIASSSGHAAVTYSAFPANAQTAVFGPPTQDTFGIALGPTTGKAYIPNATTGGAIDVYDPQFTNASTKNAAETITTPSTSYVSYIAFDASGNLYAGALNGAVFHVYVYAPPYSGPPAVDLNRGATEVDATAIGP